MPTFYAKNLCLATSAGLHYLFITKMTHPLQDIYDKVPEMDCQGHCGRDRHNTCCANIACTATEAFIMEQHIGREAAWVGTPDGMMRQNRDVYFPNIACPFLGVGGRCEVYEVRPLICRLWGATREMPCPWGCKPKRVLNYLDAMRLLNEAAKRNAQVMVEGIPS